MSNPDLLFGLSTGDACTEGDPEAEARTVAAIAAGWLLRRCNGGRGELVLTAAGELIVAKSRYGATTSDAPDGVGRITTYTIAVAQFDRTGPAVVEAAAARTMRRVLLPGRWIPNADTRSFAHGGVRSSNRRFARRSSSCV
jgi:hypothetical protein